MDRLCDSRTALAGAVDGTAASSLLSGLEAPTDATRDAGRETAANEVIERAVETARQFLGMDMAFVSETRQGLQDFRAITGDGASFGVSTGAAAPRLLEGTYCARVLDDELDHVVPDTAADARVRDLTVTHDAGIGAYVGVPVPLPDGSVYGTFCCVSHSPAPSLSDRDVQLMRVLAGLIGVQLEREEAGEQKQQLAATAGSIAALVAALEARDGYTGEHSRAVVHLAALVGQELGLSAVELSELQTVALLHDIGKIGIPDAVLHKRGQLDDEEWAQMRRHPEIGARIIGSMPGLAGLAPAIRAEHERWDGGGYPDGLSGEAIPLASRIVLVCDAYHAMTSDRPYRRSLRAADARAELRRNAGTQFCPAVTLAAIAVLAPGEFAADIRAVHGPDAAALVGRAQAHDDLADELDIKASHHERQGKNASAVIARRKASEHRAQARETRARAGVQRIALTGA